jgi:four helix bundle protein
MRTSFDHEKLEAYRLARSAIRELRPVFKAIPRGNSDLVDQLKRASLSVCLNIAEGAGAWLPAEKGRFYRTARASGTECVAVLDYLVDAGLCDPSHTDTAKDSYSRVLATLVALIRYTESVKAPVPNPKPRAPAPSPDLAPTRVQAPEARP